MPLRAVVCWYQGGGGGVTEGAEVEAVIKNLVVDFVRDMVGAKVETQAKIVAFNLCFIPGDV